MQDDDTAALSALHGFSKGRGGWASVGAIGPSSLARLETKGWIEMQKAAGKVTARLTAQGLKRLIAQGVAP
jgi:hypothetical protein